MRSIPKRGMQNGRWSTDINTLPDRRTSIRASFETPVARANIDIARLKARPESYHLFAARACPFAHRVLMMRAISGITSLGVTYCDPWLGGPDGWTFVRESNPPITSKALWQIYAASDSNYTGRVTVPVLWDCDSGTIASAESFEILESMAQAYRPDMIPDTTTFATLCSWIQRELNVGVYKIGFSTDQSAYDNAIDSLDSALDELKVRLTNGYAYGCNVTIADLMIFATAIRFDVAYHGAFQILHRRWSDEPELQEHLKHIFSLPGVSETIALDEYRVHYFDEIAFPIRHPNDDGRYIVPRTPDPLFG